MGIFDRFRDTTPDDPKNAVDRAKTRYVEGEIDRSELDSRLDRAMEVEKQEREKEREIARELQDGSPSTLIDSGGTVGKHEFEQQELGQSELREIKEIRESGGIVAQLVQARALLEFGTGAEFQSENDEVAEWLHEEFDNLDNLVIDLGEDALWFPRSFGEVVETRGGDFSHVELVEPWTMIPETNQFGEILHWTQEVQAHDAPEKRYNPDDIASFLLTKSSGRDSVGVSTVWRAKDEIQQFMDNKRSIGNAIELAGFPHMHWKVGRDDAAIIDDNELRRVRNKVQRLDSDSHIITGTDVEADQIQPTTFDFTQITQHDLRQVAIALGVPLEVASVISEGLGSGEQSSVRQQMFERQARADQRSLAGQFIEQVVNPVLEQYSPYNPENVDVDLRFGDPIQEDVSTTEFVQNNSENFTTNEIRGVVDYEPLDDEEQGESFDPPGEEGQDDGIGGIFQEQVESALESRELSTVRALQEGFDATLFELVATEEQEDFEAGARLGIGVEFPNSGVYVDWNIDAWPEEDRLDGPHVSDYATIDDAKKVAQGEVRELSAAELSDGGTGNLNLDAYPEWEASLLELHQQTWDAESDTRVLSFTQSELPEFVINRLRDAVYSDAFFHQFDGIDSASRRQMQQFLAEELTESGGWSIDGLANRLQDIDDEISFEKAEVIARTETASIANTAREMGYKERGEGDGLFYWTGNLDGRQTDACEWLIKKTNPHHGGTPVELSELKDLIEEAPTHDPEMQDGLARPEDFVVHPQERKTFVRHVEG